MALVMQIPLQNFLRVKWKDGKMWRCTFQSLAFLEPGNQVLSTQSEGKCTLHIFTFFSSIPLKRHRVARIVYLMLLNGTKTKRFKRNAIHFGIM